MAKAPPVLRWTRLPVRGPRHGMIDSRSIQVSAVVPDNRLLEPAPSPCTILLLRSSHDNSHSPFLIRPRLSHIRWLQTGGSLQRPVRREGRPARLLCDGVRRLQAGRHRGEGQRPAWHRKNGARSTRLRRATQSSGKCSPVDRPLCVDRCGHTVARTRHGWLQAAQGCQRPAQGCQRLHSRTGLLRVAFGTSRPRSIAS